MRGALLVNKPPGITSFQAISEVKKVFRPKSVGHTGSLDLIASGLLIVLFNEATKLFPYLNSVEKEYFVEALLGYETLSCDEQGEIIYEKEVGNIDVHNFKNILKLFRAKIYQRPPIFCSLKYKGERFNEMARKGIFMPPLLRKVYIREIEFIEFVDKILTFKVVVGTGVYIRSLIRDVGRKLGTGAVVKNLKRTRIDRFKVGDAYSLDNLKDAKILTVEELLPSLSRLTLTEKGVYKALNGQNLILHDFVDLKSFKYLTNLLVLKDQGGNIFLLGRNKDTFVHPERLIYNDNR